MRQARPAPRGGLEPDRRSATATPSSWRRWRSPAPRSTRSRPRSVTSRGRRSARCRSRSPRAEGLERDAPQAEPGPVRADLRPGPPRRGNAQAALENAVLWHERDISHSSAERVILPDSTIAARLHARGDDGGARGAAGLPGADAREPARRRWARVLAERPARARRRGDVARRCVRGRSGRPRSGLGRGAVVPRAASRRIPRWRPDRRLDELFDRAARAAEPRRPCSTGWRRWRCEGERQRGPAPRAAARSATSTTSGRPARARRHRPDQRVRRGAARRRSPTRAAS